MKILFLNGTARPRGNSKQLLETIALAAQAKGHEVQTLDVCRMQIAGCLGCDGCKKNGGNCVQKDDFAAVVQQAAWADCIVFGTPVYWWGMSAQLKAVIDRFYSNMQPLQNKKFGLVIVGANALDDPQYRLIKEQFSCIANYLGSQLLFCHTASAWQAGEVLQNTQLLEACKKEGEML